MRIHRNYHCTTFVLKVATLPWKSLPSNSPHYGLYSDYHCSCSGGDRFSSFQSLCICAVQNVKIPCCDHCMICLMSFSFAILYGFLCISILNSVASELSIDICTCYSVPGFPLHIELLTLL